MAKKMPPYALTALFKSGLSQRNSTLCHCGYGLSLQDIKPHPDAAKLDIATCPECGKKWGIWRG